MNSSRSFEEWVDVATRGLSKDSKRRVRDEIRDHLDAAIESGLDRRAALDGLGSARVARRGFRRVYLTRFQEQLVTDYRSSPRGWRLGVHAGLLALVSSLAVFVPQTIPQRLVGLAAVASLFTACVGLFWLGPRFYRRGREGAGVLVGAFSDFALYTVGVGGTALVLGSPIWRLTGIYSVALVVLLVLYIPTYPKLRDERKTRGAVR